jgi:cysteine desulfurase family protein (TIGR01976 family)
MSSDLKALDPLFVRAQFPAPLWEWAFFENAGGVYVPRCVIERITAYMSECQVQPGTNFPLAAKALERMNAGHARMAAMIGAEPGEVIVGASTSINAYVLANALRPLWRQGDEVIVAIQNHEANSGPWRRLAASGIKVLDWPVHPETGTLDTGVLADLLSERTRLVAFPHVSNILGAINDVATITRIAHAAGAEVCVDGVAFAPHRAVDVKAWDVDYYLFSFYKIFGPHMGCLYGKMEKLVAAANQGHYFFADDDTTHKLNPAGPQHEMIASLAGIDDYFEALAGHHLGVPANDALSRQKRLFEMVAEHEAKLAARFLDFVNSRNDIHLLGPAEASRNARVATFSFTVRGRRSAEIPPRTAKHRVGVSNGHFYAKRLIEALGVEDPDDGVVRASIAQYNTLDEVDRLIEALEKAI